MGYTLGEEDPEEASYFTQIKEGMKQDRKVSSNIENGLIRSKSFFLIQEIINRREFS